MSDLSLVRGDSPAPQRAPNGQFLPGASPNPDGRPALSREFRLRCRNFMTRTGWALLESIATDPFDRDRFRALELILAYAHGKPKPGLEPAGQEGGPPSSDDMTTEERRQRIRELLVTWQMDEANRMPPYNTPDTG